MTLRYDIFLKEGENGLMWMDAVEDICAARKRLVSLASAKPGEYRVWDPSRQQFVDLSRQRFRDSA